MASESINKPMNGNYGSQQPYNVPEPPLSSEESNGTASISTTGAFSEDNGSPPNAVNSSTTGTSEGNGSVPKDEVGWYFVEQYYTTLSKHPDRLHLFYSKRSQFVSGIEAEKVSVSVGQRAINERIKELDIQDCKVRVSNVDSQESFKNIVVQVIGEMSNKAAPHRKFVQTFVLAEQPNGYFVLNDIFRYINEDEDEPENEDSAPIEDTAPPTTDIEVKTLTSSAGSAQQQQDAEQIDKKLEDEASNETHISSDDANVDLAVPQSVATSEDTDVTPAEDAPAAAVTTPEKDDQPVQETTEISGDVSDTQLEKAKDPEPTPVASPPVPTSAKTTPTPTPPSVAPAKPAAPKTWANLVASNSVAAPAVPNQSQINPMSSAPPQLKAAPSLANRSVTPPTSSIEETQVRTPQNGNAGWQMAGQENGKRQNRQQPMPGNPEKDNVLAYIKNVTERVDASLLKTTLLQYGKLVYFDVSRPKNCAFVEFADAEGYNSAVAANPHSIDGEQIYVEERRPRPNAYGSGFGGRGSMRGGRPGNNDGRPGSQGRGNYPKDGARGGFVPRGRGGSMTPRGRGQPQAA